jgi:hypothetical protein
MTLASVMLGASGGVRAWQDARFATKLSRVEAPPFPLRELPKTLGDWRVRAGGETSLDPEVARIAGSTDHVIRTYVNARTGVSLNVLVLFGPAQFVFGHLPEVCYPAVGYARVGEPLLRTIASGSGPAAEFRSEVYIKKRDARSRREEVYSGFHQGGRWSPDPLRFWKNFRHNPSMFKVQIQRSVTEAEHRELNNPTEQFLALLLPELERRIAAAASGRQEGN